MGDRTDGQRMDDETDDGTHGFKGGFISHPDVLYYIGFSLGFRDYSVESPNTMLAIQDKLNKLSYHENFNV